VNAFTYQGSPQRVVFGTGTIANVPAEIERLGLTHVLVLSTPGHTSHAEAVAVRLGSRCAGTFAGARMHTPIAVTEAAMTVVRDRSIDGTVAIGGGSAIGLGKAIALRTDLAQLVVPTTYAGSEATSTLGETRDGLKNTVRDPKILPEVIVYDVSLTRTLPPALSVASGLNAMAHAVEGLYAKDANPISSLMAEEGIRALGSALPAIVRTPSDDEARAKALYGAWLCGTVLGSTSMALHHKLCHVLGGAFDLPHAQTHAILLPHVTAYNAEAATNAIDRVARALDASDAARALFGLLDLSGGPTALRDIGMPETGIDHAAELALNDTFWNPRPVTREGIRQLLSKAWRGAQPS